MATPASNDPDVAQFLVQVNCRHIPAFFLGCMFIAALYSMVTSNLIQSLVSKIRASPTARNLDSEKASIDTESSICSISSPLAAGDSRTLIFLLAFCFASASITLFASILSFPIGAGAACAFLTAWGHIASQAARMVGLFILFLELRMRGCKRWESIIFIVGLFIGTVFVFVSNALGSGVTTNFTTLGVSLCTRRHFLPAALTSSLIYIHLEAYAAIRLWSLIFPQFLQLRHQLAGINDFRILRAISLLLLEFLTIVPYAVNTDIIADFVPGSIGALIVLWAFRFRPAETDAATNTIPANSIERFPVWTPRQTVAPSVYTELSDQLRSLQHHPFSSKALSDPSSWPEPRTARSSRTIDTVSARSIRNAVVQVAKRSIHPFNQRIEHLPPPASSPLDLSPLPLTADSRVFMPPRIVPSQIALEDQLEKDGKTLPKALVRPRLMVVATPTTLDNRIEVVNSPGPETPTHQPASTSVFRLTPTFISDVRSHLSLASTKSSSESHSLPPLPQSPDLRPSDSTESDSSESSTGTVDRKRTTFGASFKPSRYANSIPSRWSNSATLSHRETKALPEPLPLPAEWPVPPPFLATSVTTS